MEQAAAQDSLITRDGLASHFVVESTLSCGQCYFTIMRLRRWRAYPWVNLQYLYNLDIIYIYIIILYNLYILNRVDFMHLDITI